MRKNKVHAQKQGYIAATLCGEKRIVIRTWDRDEVTCKSCLSMLRYRK